MKVTKTCPIRQPENIVEKLNSSSCLVQFCWFVQFYYPILILKKLTDIIADAKQVFSAKNVSEKSTFSCIKYLKAKTREPIGCAMITFRQI